MMSSAATLLLSHRVSPLLCGSACRSRILSPILAFWESLGTRDPRYAQAVALGRERFAMPPLQYGGTTPFWGCRHSTARRSEIWVTATSIHMICRGHYHASKNRFEHLIQLASPLLSAEAII